MILHSLRLQSFRAHAETELHLAPKVNLLYGPNGVGKTNVLEAIHYLCLTKSFVASRDTYVLRKECPYFQVEGVFDSARRSEIKVRLVYMPGEGKKVFVNGAPLDRLADIVGRLPVVVFSPQDHALTAEGPSERRRFLDNILSQAHPVYLDNLLKYRRARRQRNELLKQYQKRRAAPPDHVMAPWTEELVTLGSRIIARRLRFLEAFSEYLTKAYRQIEAVAEEPSIEYDTIADFGPADDADAITEAFRERIERTKQRERERGRTLVGPQRDELIFRLNAMQVRRYGSQGQHRTFGMALKLAQYFFLADRLEEQPILLLDDAFGKLDPARSAAFLQLLQSEAIGQSVVTSTRRAPFEETVTFDDARHRAIAIEREDTRAQVAAAF